MKFHPLAEIFPALEGQPLAELIADIKANGLREAIWLHQDGRILDGRNRYIACSNLAVKPSYRTYEGDDALAFVLSMNLARRHLNESQRAMVAARVATITEAGRPKEKEIVGIPTISQGKAAETLSVSRDSVNLAHKVQQKADKEIIASVDRGDMAVSMAAKLADKPKELQREIVKKMEFTGKSAPEVLKSMNVHVSNNSGENEWYTPADIIKAVRLVMGDIDLDPASSEIANKTVKADKFYSLKNDGLQQSWAGRIFMNPPYSNPEIKLFCKKLIEEYEAGFIPQAIVLVNNATETEWFQSLMEHAVAVCFPRSRIKFLDPSGKPSGAPLQGQAIIYICERLGAFNQEFEKFGTVLRAI